MQWLVQGCRRLPRRASGACGALPLFPMPCAPCSSRPPYLADPGVTLSGRTNRPTRCSSPLSCGAVILMRPACLVLPRRAARVSVPFLTVPEGWYVRCLLQELALAATARCTQVLGASGPLDGGKMAWQPTPPHHRPTCAARDRDRTRRRFTAGASTRRAPLGTTRAAYVRILVVRSAVPNTMPLSSAARRAANTRAKRGRVGGDRSVAAWSTSSA